MPFLKLEEQAFQVGRSMPTEVVGGPFVDPANTDRLSAEMTHSVVHLKPLQLHIHRQSKCLTFDVYLKENLRHAVSVLGSSS